LLLRPDAAVTQILLYALAISARRFGLEVHALCAMSSHVHLVVTDVEGRLPQLSRVLPSRSSRSR
jgi:putative transposase